ncbi:MAG: hypothetical protein P9X24_09145 [Candidatus Hatepunaea meridiana]|nr:hypothetical protein [Candidatus Hatepunaea meridiana]
MMPNRKVDFGVGVSGYRGVGGIGERKKVDLIVLHCSDSFFGCHSDESRNCKIIIYANNIQKYHYFEIL